MASPRIPARVSAVAALALLSSCSTIESVDIGAWQRENGLELTQNDAPPGAETLRLLSAHRTGFYLLGLLPIVPAHFSHCVEQIVAEAREAGADGVSNLRLRYEPPSFFSLAEPTFPWMAKATITGTAYRRKRAAAPADAERGQ